MAKDFGGNGGGGPARGDANSPALPNADVAVGAGIPAFPRAQSGAGGTVRAPLAPGSVFGGAASAGSEPRAAVRERELVQPTAPADDEGSEFRIAGLSLPNSVASISKGRKLWFGISFLAPVILGALYLFLIAPDQYVTEYRFSVRVPVGQAGSMANGGASLSALFGGNPTPGTDLLDNYTVADYASSSQAALDLNAKVNLRDMFNKPFDPFSRVGKTASSEKLAKFWRSMVYSNYDAASGLAVVRVKAYSPQDSYAIATSLLSLSSDLVNAIGSRSQQDTVRFAQMQVDRAAARLAVLRSQLTGLRRERAIITPQDGNTDAVSGNSALQNSLLARQNQLNGQISALMAQLHNPNAPQIVVLRQQLTATNQQLSQARAAVGAGADGNLSVTVGKFEDLQAQVNTANNVLQSYTANLSQVQAGADSQRLYLTTYVKPNLAETSQEPNRWLSLFGLMLIAGMVWLIGMLIGKSVLEHGQ